MIESKKKITIVGAGAVGSTFAYALAQSGIVDEIAICDVYTSRAIGQVMDLTQGVSYMPKISIHVGTDDDFTDSDVVVITAGCTTQEKKKKEQLILDNTLMMAGIAKRVAAANCRGVMLVVTNPVDYLTQVAYEASGWTRDRVIGSGTVLDSVRFSFALSREFSVSAKNVYGLILGEHGENEFAAWSLTNICGMQLGDFSKSCGGIGKRVINRRSDIVREVKQSAYHIMNFKGSSSYAIATALMSIVSAILRDDNSILPVSVKLTGEYGIDDTTLSVPCVLGLKGVKKVISAKLNQEELDALNVCAEKQRAVKARIDELRKNMK